jgi:hypothetical protein
MRRSETASWWVRVPHRGTRPSRFGRPARARRCRQGECAAHRDLEPETFPSGQAGSVGRQGKVSRRLRSRHDGHRLPGRLGMRPADCGLADQTASDGGGRTRRAGARRSGGISSRYATEITPLSPPRRVVVRAELLEQGAQDAEYTRPVPGVFRSGERAEIGVRGLGDRGRLPRGQRVHGAYVIPPRSLSQKSPPSRRGRRPVPRLVGAAVGRKSVPCCGKWGCPNRQPSCCQVQPPLMSNAFAPDRSTVSGPVKLSLEMMSLIGSRLIQRQRAWSGWPVDAPEAERADSRRGGSTPPP